MNPKTNLNPSAKTIQTNHLFTSSLNTQASDTVEIVHWMSLFVAVKSRKNLQKKNAKERILWEKSAMNFRVSWK